MQMVYPSTIILKHVEIIDLLFNYSIFKHQESQKIILL